MSVHHRPFLLLWAVLLTLSGCAHAQRGPAAGCPQVELGEAPEDCPWADIARLLIEENTQHRPLLPILRTQASSIMGQIAQDRLNPLLQPLWGQSINYDEYAKGVIVEPSILATLTDAFGVPDPTLPGTPHSTVHAGLEHTYGYLFSILRTPFGYKRARWVQGEIEAGFGLPTASLSPNTSEGTLLANITWFAGNIAFRKDKNGRERLLSLPSTLPSGLRDFDFSRLQTLRLVETAQIVNEQGKKRTVQLRTDFVSFLYARPNASPAKEANSHVLIYSIADPGKQGPQLISMFPVQTSFVTRAVDPAGLGKNKPITSRYNAFVEDLTWRQGIQGVRSLVRE